ncbi:unnamed protein product [Rotaria sp. Silwood1]|nr:unnamed protein product [Rotaria sp. Silwood1]
MSKKGLTEEELEKLIRDGDPVIKFIDACKELFLDSSLSGANNLCAHVKSGPRKEKSSLAYQKSKLVQGFCALGARAFDVVEGDGFKNLAKILFGVGRCSNTSSIEITDLLPHPTTLQHAFQSDQIHLNKSTIEKVACELVQNIFNQVKKVVSSVRHSHQQQTFSQKLQTKTLNDYSLIEKELLDDICNYLEPFQEILDAVSEDQQPSLHRVIPLRQYLMNKCEVKEEDSATIIRLEVLLACRIKNAWHITDHHRLSTILHPKLKNFDCCSDDKEKSINVLKQEFEKHKLIDSSSCTNNYI